MLLPLGPVPLSGVVLLFQGRERLPKGVLWVVTRSGTFAPPVCTPKEPREVLESLQECRARAIVTEVSEAGECRRGNIAGVTSSGAAEVLVPSPAPASLAQSAAKAHRGAVLTDPEVQQAIRTARLWLP